MIRKSHRLLSFIFLFVGSAIVSCDTSDTLAEIDDPSEKEETPNTNAAITFLALGDSYTIGQGVAIDDSWPMLLESRLLAEGFDVETEIVARTGWTTGDLLNALSNNQPSADQYALVSLLIGVNNQYQGKSQQEFSAQFEDLLKKAIALASDQADRVFVLSIPDYSVTPFGQSGDPDQIQQELDEFNEVKKEITASYDVQYFNITDLSRRAANDLSLLASDQLHPSASMYSLWVSRIESTVTGMIK